MPTYEYECRECAGRVEAFQKMSDEPLTTCADCGGSLRRLLFPVGIVFKGSGFYVTDYKNKENGSSGSSTSKSSDSSGSATKSSTEKSASDSKPAESKAAASS
jgi:putative FmdB family regulatory protein